MSVRYFILEAYGEDEDATAFVEMSNGLEKLIKKYAQGIKQFENDEFYCVEFFNYDVKFFVIPDEAPESLRDYLYKILAVGGGEVKPPKKIVKWLEGAENIGESPTLAKVYKDGSVAWTDEYFTTDAIHLNNGAVAKEMIK